MHEENDYPIAAKLKGPGPARYGLPSTCGYVSHDVSKHMKPAWTFGNRFKDLIKLNTKESPGPAHFVRPEMTRNGKDGTPAYSMLARAQDSSEFRTPAPCCYYTEHVHPQGEAHAPAYTMRARCGQRSRDANPAPNSYGLPPLIGSNQVGKKSSPSYSMTNRMYVGSYYEDLARTPGPCHYKAMEPNIIYNKQPIYGLQGRTTIPNDKTRIPGPGQHYPEHVYINKHQAAAHSMGIRHSKYITLLFAEG